jgi:DNA polymerase-3 subunit alpha
MCKIDELVLRAKELNQHAIAITDHGALSGIYDFYKTCKQHNIQPIYGVEFYHYVEGHEKRFHIICFAKSMKGLKNLYALQELSYKQKYKGKPVVTYEDLYRHKQDIVVSTACVGGHIPYMITHGMWNEIYSTLENMKTMFGDDYYLELQSNTLYEQKVINRDLYNLSQLYDITPILTADIHYVYKDDAKIHEMLLCMQTKGKMSDEKRFKFPSNDYWLRSEEEMIKDAIGLTKEEAEKCLSNTMLVANKCCFEYEVPSKEEALPKYSENEQLALRQMCNRGWLSKQHNKSIVEKQRVNFELNVIEQKGYSGYYLIVADYIQWAKNNGVIVGGGRGSGAGSMVGYLCDITTLNPIDNHLLFERFLNPERITSPDFDTDFSAREPVIEYLKKRWGEDCVSSIIAFGKLTAKAVIRKVLGIHGFTQLEINKLSKSLPKKLNLTLADCEESDVFRSMKKQHPDLFKAMYRLEGTIDHVSQHAAGVLIVPKAVREFVPTMYDAKTNMLVSCFDKYMLEEIGLYKFDILKLVTLSVIDKTLELIRARHGESIDMLDLDRMSDKDDPNVYDSLCQGDVIGVFQLEEQQDMTKQIQPKDFEALTALNSLIRPGTGNPDEYIARMNGKEFSYLSDLEIPYMKSTYNTITYQEQIMMRVHTLAGWSLGKGDSLRKVKKIREQHELHNEFIWDCQHKGVLTSLEAIETAWSEIVDALDGGYSFNASHAACYAEISYQTAWLKYYYPLEFMCALMTYESTDQESISKRVKQCVQMGIKVLPPDISKSSNEFIIENDAIVIPFNTIKGVGDNAIQHLISLDYNNINTFNDFLTNIDSRLINKTIITNMVYAGCFDHFDSNRYRLLNQYYMHRGSKSDVEYANELATKEHKQSDLAKMERESLGFYLQHSPFKNYNFKPLQMQVNNVIIGGEIKNIKTLTDKNKKQMAFVTLETEFENVDVVIFSSQYSSAKQFLQSGNFVMVVGKKDGSKVLLNKIQILE